MAALQKTSTDNASFVDTSAHPIPDTEKQSIAIDEKKRPSSRIFMKNQDLALILHALLAII